MSGRELLFTSTNSLDTAFVDNDCNAMIFYQLEVIYENGIYRSKVYILNKQLIVNGNFETPKLTGYIPGWMGNYRAFEYFPENAPEGLYYLLGVTYYSGTGGNRDYSLYQQISLEDIEKEKIYYISAKLYSKSNTTTSVKVIANTETELCVVELKNDKIEKWKGYGKAFNFPSDMTSVKVVLNYSGPRSLLKGRFDVIKLRVQQ
jgi:hypothetical protein